ncbi:CDP-diacylglycerol--serine O-phosphatidyltransferase [Agaricicola taiwanensis]|uniref:CDP-diacylglycerol--serine O-phosphatidyltransferase n=1 Tax=Agaricicola taiwanensis TaxID=591372 RepID=A0A8J2VU95_9RHOB|nr:CDP-diacylglycerol--serine O-phosphatidyltransferase [Agaricicola taiwanensis]GGE37721.1 CDP-diacylglycerol--serine O-phosphatidyltransferase [Agaricicola taiwanensis]
MRWLFSPFDPDPATPRVRRFRPVPVRILIPNLITLLALCIGLTAIRMAIEGRIELAIYAIVVAAALDGIDGRLARALKATSRFGAHLDSLADFVNFGVAPALLLYVWVLGDARSIGWLAALAFALSAALRLARFNAALDGPESPAFAQDYFVGVPAPAGALVVLLPVYLAQLGLPSPPFGAAFAIVFCLAVGLLMVSRIPTYSGKKASQSIAREWVAPLFVGAIIAVGLLVSYPWEVMSLVTIGYLMLIPFAYMRYHRLKAAHDAREAAGSEPEPAPVPEGEQF